MGRLLVVESVTLDGVMQSPARPDEDPRGGFDRGGWAVPYADAAIGEAMAKGFPGAGAILLGRRTYMDFVSVWPHTPEDNQYAKVLNETTKHVASTTLQEPLPWRNSAVLSGDVIKAVGELKEELTKDIVVLGSGELVASLMARDLVDSYTLLIHPLVLGSGRRLFTDGVTATLRLLQTTTTPTGVVIATYDAERQ